MNERRGTLRVPAVLFVRFKSTEVESEGCGGFTADLSLDGMQILSPRALVPDSDLELTIDVPDSPQLTFAEGCVRWLGEISQDENGNEVYPTGVAFTYIDPRDRNDLADYLKRS